MQGNTVRDTGLRRDKFGEGVYIGTAESPTGATSPTASPTTATATSCAATRISATTAESVDIKEGTTGGIVDRQHVRRRRAQRLARRLLGRRQGQRLADRGQHRAQRAADGFQTHEVVDGWGTDNVFTGNTAEVNGPGCGFHFAPVAATRSPATTRSPARRRASPTSPAADRAARTATSSDRNPIGPARPACPRTARPCQDCPARPITRPRRSAAAAPASTVIGTGYLGATHAICMAVLGYEVLGVDVDAGQDRPSSASGEVPFFEPGLPELLRQGPRDRAAAVHHVVRRGRPSSATCTSSASARRSRRRLRRRRPALRGRGRHRAGPAPDPPGPGRRQVDRAGRHRGPADRAGARQPRRPATRSSSPGTRSSSARASPCDDTLQPGPAGVRRASALGRSSGCGRRSHRSSREGDARWW